MGVAFLSTKRALERAKKPEEGWVQAQQYVAPPFLVHDLKFTLRMMVYVAPGSPLRAYIYPAGLTSFAGVPFNFSSK
jgi:hypothetical protein